MGKILLLSLPTPGGEACHLLPLNLTLSPVGNITARPSPKPNALMVPIGGSSVLSHPSAPNSLFQQLSIYANTQWFDKCNIIHSLAFMQLFLQYLRSVSHTSTFLISYYDHKNNFLWKNYAPNKQIFFKIIKGCF